MKTDRTKTLLSLLLFAVLSVGFFFEGLFGGKVIQGIDGNYSRRLHFQQNLVADSGAWWDASHWLGSGGLFPLKTKFFFSRFLSMQWELTAYYIAVLFAAQLFMFLFLRRLRLPVAASLFGALAWAFSPHFLTLIYPSHIGPVCLIAYVPILFYFLYLALSGEASGWRSWLCAVPSGSAWGMMLNEDVQRGLYFSVAAGAYALFLILRKAEWKPLRIEWIRLIRLGLVGSVMLGVFSHNAKVQFGSELVSGKVSGVQQNSPQAEEEKWAFATSWSLNPKELVDSLAPGYHGMISGDPERPYWGARPIAHSNDGLGFFVLIFGVAGSVLAFRTSGTVRFFAIAAVLATLLAFGQYLPGRPLFWLWYKLPMMAKMRAPVKFMAVTSFALAVLSAYGFRSLLVAFEENRKKILVRWASAFGVLALLGGVGLLGVVSGDSSLQGGALDGAVQALLWMVVFSGSSAVFIGIASVDKRLRSYPWAVWVLFSILLLIDLWQIDQFYLRRSWFKPSEFYRPDGVVQFLRAQEPGRVATSFKIMYEGRMIPLQLAANRSAYITHIFPYFGIPSIEETPQSRIAGDYDTFFHALLPFLPQVRSPQALVQQVLEGQLRFWRLSGVRYVVTDGYLYGLSQQPLPIMDVLSNRPELTLVYSGAGLGRPHAVFELKETLPAFSLFSATERLAERDDEAERLHSSTFDPLAAVVVTSENAPQVGKTYNGFLPVEVVDESPSRVELSINAPADSILLWSSRFDRRWKVQVDGKDVETFPADYILTGIPVPAGSHDVVLRYSPATGLQRASMIVAWVGLLSIPLCLLTKSE